MKVGSRAQFLASSALFVALTAFSAPAFAQDSAANGGTAAEANAADAGDDAIIVTARRRSELLQDVPIAVTAVNAEAMAARGWDAVSDLQQAAPNISFTPGQGGNSGGIAPFIRGVGENDFIITSDPAVGLYIDGVYIARTFGAMTELMGIDQIEVLRGPQGSLFGKNTIGGAINITTHTPESYLNGEADVRYGRFNDVRVRARVDVPLSDSWSLGLSALGNFGEGWQRIPSGKNLGNRNVIAGRATLHHDGDLLDMTLSVDGLHRRQNSAAHSMLAFTPSFFSGLQSSFLGPCCTVPPNINQTDSTPFLNRDDGDALNTNLKLAYDIGDGRLTSITAYRWLHMIFGRDGDASAAINYAGDIHDERTRQFSQELQYNTPFAQDRGNLLIGAYYFREHSTDATQLIVAEGLYQALLNAGFPPPVATALDFNIDFLNRQVTTNYALFGNVTFDITDALTIELGGRYTHERKRFFQQAIRNESGAPLLAGTPSYRLAESWNNFSPRASLSYDLADNAMLYASWTRGFRSGGFNGRPTSLEEVGSYDPETLTAWEMGIKTEPSHGFTFNVSAFRNNYRNQQLLITTVSASTGLLVVRTENAGRSRIQGVEVETSARITPELTLSGAIGLLDAKYLRFISVIAGVPTDVSNRTPKQAPEVTAAASIAYDTDLSEQLAWGFRIDANYRTATFIDVENTPLLRAPRHVLMNISTSFTLPQTGWSLRLAVDNVTNQRVPVAGYDGSGAFGFVEAYFNDPRRWSATIAYRF